MIDLVKQFLSSRCLNPKTLVEMGVRAFVGDSDTLESWRQHAPSHYQWLLEHPQARIPGLILPLTDWCGRVCRFQYRPVQRKEFSYIKLSQDASALFLGHFSAWWHLCKAAVLVEGFTDAEFLFRTRLPVCAALTNSISVAALQFIARSVPVLYEMLDNDDGGDTGRQEISDKLAAHAIPLKVVRVRYPFKDVDLLRSSPVGDVVVASLKSKMAVDCGSFDTLVKAGKLPYTPTTPVLGVLDVCSDLMPILPH